MNTMEWRNIQANRFLMVVIRPSNHNLCNFRDIKRIFRTSQAHNIYMTFQTHNISMITSKKRENIHTTEYLLFGPKIMIINNDNHPNKKSQP